MKDFKTVTLDFINEFMDYSHQIPKGGVISHITEDQLAKIDSMDIPEKGRDLEEVIKEMCGDIMPYGNHSSHPRFFGFVPGTTSPLSWLGDIITTAYNRHGGSVANQPGIWRAEQRLTRWLCDAAGFPETAGGTFVSGGSMANLTAMTAARDHLLSEEEWHMGTAYVSDQTHSSVAKGLRILGIGNSRIRVIPTDDRFCMVTDLLEKAIKEDIRKGFRPFIAIASAGTTNTGSVDDFGRIRRICDKYDMWMHVDGAFGASVLLSQKYRKELDGIEKADSLSWDAHKWLFQTFGCGIVLVRDQKHLLESFSVHPEYLKDLEKDGTLVNPWDMSIELTRPARSMKLWLTLQVMGKGKVSGDIEHGIEMARWTEEKIKNNENIEIISHAKLGMINFRYVLEGLTEEQTDRLNAAISEKMLSDGYAGVFTTELKGKKVLRMCILHPDVTKEELMNTLILLEKYYGEAAGEFRKAILSENINCCHENRFMV